MHDDHKVCILFSFFLVLVINTYGSDFIYAAYIASKIKLSELGMLISEVARII